MAKTAEKELSDQLHELKINVPCNYIGYQSKSNQNSIMNGNVYQNKKGMEQEMISKMIALRTLIAKWFDKDGMKLLSAMDNNGWIDLQELIYINYDELSRIDKNQKQRYLLYLYSYKMLKLHDYLEAKEINNRIKIRKISYDNECMNIIRNIVSGIFEEKKIGEYVKMRHLIQDKQLLDVKERYLYCINGSFTVLVYYSIRNISFLCFKHKNGDSFKPIIQGKQFKSLDSKEISKLRIYKREPNVNIFERKWIYNNDIKNEDEFNKEFKVMSWNILCDKLFRKYDYNWCAKKLYDYEWRASKIFNIIKEMSCDIVCLQEMNDFGYYEYFEKELKNIGYENIYKKKTDTYFHGVCIGFKENMFKMIQYKYIEIKNIQEYCKNDKQKRRFRSAQIGVLLHLEYKNNTINNRIIIVSTHISSRFTDELYQLMQIKYLFFEIENYIKIYCKNNPNIPVIICGDFNILPQSNAYNFIINGNITNNEIGIIGNDDTIIPFNNPSHNLKLYSSYNNVIDEPKFTCFVESNQRDNRGFVGCVDYIFHSKNISCKSVLQTYTSDYIFNTQLSLPSTLIPSDHIPISSQFLWN